MRRIALVLACSIGLSGVGVPAATAATTRDLYMVKDIEYIDDGLYVGEFAALRKTGKRVVGAVGAFSSEYVCLRGRVRDGKLRGFFDGSYGEAPTRYVVRWKGTGKNQHIKGFAPISKAQMSVYLGSDPMSMIDACLAG
ncbi:MAG: hypothetical protein MUF33_06305 [Candidatus Nanopelagicales bacterium]|jgi:hypothetical protein|nr:hypothetical protein [Candidatus Nanopelagicales bacterium]MCU0295029.1 hypothetical protein [Candidatus Nanopelagicales bacterium]MCU0298117.1 hypothetical protein [Candidatus Nanopelagicales bacterium]